MIVYKVVETAKDKMLSVSALWNNPYSVAYEVGKTARPLLGYLYAFVDFKNAKRFAILDGTEDARILKCEAEVVPDTVKISFRNFEQFWEDPETYGIAFADGVTFPHGCAVYCTEVTPICFVDKDGVEHESL